MKKTKKEGVYTRELTNGTISYIITYRINGKPYKKRLGTDREGWTVQLAHKERLKRIVEDKEPINANEKLVLDDIASEYFLSIAHKVEHRNNISKYSNHIKEMLGYKLIHQVKVLDVNKLKNNLSMKVSVKTGRLLSPKTVNDIIDLLNTIYAYYNKVHHTHKVESPAHHSLVERYKTDNSRVRYLSVQEYKELLDAISNRNDFTRHRNTLEYRTVEMILYTKLLITTGVRTYSALTIKVKDIDLKHSRIKVINHKSNRTYYTYIHPSLEQELEDITKTVPQEYYLFGQSSKPYHRSTINKRLQPILNRLFNDNVTSRKDKVVVHTLRHTFGSWLAQKGTSLYIISKLMDHSDISQTKVYAKLLPNSGLDELRGLSL